MPEVKTPVATPAQIVAFKQGAAARYRERGVKPEDADRLFDAYTTKQAQARGLVPTDKTRV